MSRSIANSIAPFAAAAAALAMGVVVLMYAIDPPEEDALREFVATTGIIALSTAIVFGVVVPRALAKGGSTRIALTLSLLGLLTAAAYFIGVSPVLALGGVALAWGSREGEHAGLARAAIAIGCLAVLANLAVFIADMSGT